MCSRILWRDSGEDLVIVGRNMDWFEDMGTTIWAMPRNTERNGLTMENPLKWKSRYGSLVAVAYGIGAADGMNEKGLDCNMLFLAESDYGRRDARLPGLSLSLWPQFFLDSFAAVEEAVDYMDKHPFQVRPITAGVGRKVPVRVHLSLADRSGDSAIVEVIDGRPVVYHGREFRVMTNSPPFDRQIEGMKKYAGFGGAEALPGSTKAADRFVRAAYYLSRLPDEKDERRAIAGVLSIMRNVSQPFGTVTPDEPNTSPTIYRTVADLTDGTYFYESTTSPSIIWIDMKKVDLGNGVKKLEPSDMGMAGDVTSLLRPAAPFKPAAPDEEMPAALL